MECHEIESAVFAKERRVKNKTSLPRFDLKKYRVEEATAVVIVTVGDDRRVQSMYGGQFRLFHYNCTPQISNTKLLELSGRMRSSQTPSGLRPTLR